MAKGRDKGFFYSSGWMAISLLIAAIIGAIAIFEFRSGPFIGGFLSLLTYGALAYLLPTRVGKSRPSALSNALGSPSDDPRVDLLVEAHQHVQSLSQTKPNMPPSMAETIEALALDAGVIIAAVTEEPSKLTPVLRFFTYYLPSTADLATDRVKLAPHAGDARLQEIDHTLKRLTEAFAGFKQAVISPELASVDIDMSLLDDALDADLEDLKTR